LPYLLNKGFSPVIGIEPSTAAIEAAPQTVRPLIREGMFTSSMLDGVTSSLICSFMILEHLKHPGNFVTDVYQLLEPGGAIAVAVHNWRAPVNRLLGRRSPIIDVEHLQLFSPKSVGELLKKAGFTKIRYTSAHTRMPESSVLNLKNCSYRISAEIEITSKSNHGVIACQGGNMAGWSLYLDDKTRPIFHYNWFGHEHTSFAGVEPLGIGKHLIEVSFAYDGGFGAGGTVWLFVDKSEVTTGRIEKTVPLVFSMSGETFDVGIDTGSPVGPYPHDYECTAKIFGVTLEKLDEPQKDVQEKMRAGEFRASLSTQ
ncbi:MAG: class I SAM-dependent methyltransferase, partial [Actinobacteria bacterium]|nr:class I SAM-dependent methyltransferase [Actinomycetota bacterium]